MSEPQPHPPLNELEFSRQVEAVRPALRGYLMSLLPERDLVDDVFQETLLYLWKSRENFTPGTSFRGWAFKCGYFSVLAKRRDRFRDKTVCYPDEFFLKIAEHAERHADQADERLGALRECLSGLGAGEMALLEARYFRREEGTTLTKAFPENTGKFHRALSRLRLRLKLCIEKRIKTAQ